MVMPGRSYSAASQYRYGFNRKENDKDISEGGQDYGMRIYDARLGRFLSVDPLTGKFAYFSPYSFSGNSPIKFIDLDGAEPKGNAADYVDYIDPITNKRWGGVYNVPALGIADLRCIYDAASKQWWTIGKPQANSDPNLYYWKGDPNLIKKGSGNFEVYETNEQRQARLAKNDRNLYYAIVGPIVAIPAIIVAGFGIAGVSLESAGSFLMDKAATLYYTYWRYAATIGAIGKTTAAILDESGGVAMQEASLAKASIKYAFGFENNARQLAAEINGSHLMDFKGDWKSEFLNIINDKTKDIHFNLKDIEGSLYSNIVNPGRSSTNWELNALYQNKEAFERTIFHVGEKTYTGSQVFEAPINN